MLLFADCTVEKIWLVIRHGTRYPDDDTAKKFVELTDVSENIYDYIKICIE